LTFTVEKWSFPLINFLGEPELFSEKIKLMIDGNVPFFLSRIGGSDTDAVIDYLAVRNLQQEAMLDAHIAEHLPIVSRYNGFYSKFDLRENYFKYLESLISCYQAINFGTVCGSKLLSVYFPRIVHESHRRYPRNIAHASGFFNYISNPWRKLNLYPYNLIESFGTNHTLISALASSLNGKRVLVVSPFAESIESNFHRRHTFFKEVKYPEFDVCVVNTPITYEGLPEEFYPHDNWLETVGHLTDLVKRQSFDVALLSCGSYALPIGEFIKNAMGRKVVYVGGVLQLFFGIMGRRYENIFFTQHLNLDSFIYPIEKDKYLAGKNIPESMAKEAFGAYF
jgi:hypothetical protein